MNKKKSRVKIGFNKALSLILTYSKKKVVEQIKSVSVIILYLIFFQLIVLRIPIAEAMTIAAGLTLVVIGLSFFMEGLLLGLMPLGEVCGIKLPRKTKLPVIMIFAFILGMGATFAEPAIGVLKAAGSSVKAWDAPLLFLLLNKYSSYLVYAVGVGVGIAVVFGMLRFLYNWSLKPFIYILVSILCIISMGALFFPNLMYLSGLAWDCGAITTGPVTVPLVLALGIGISKVVGGSDNGAGGGFGVVTLASALPILTVYLLGIFLLNATPNPDKVEKFFSEENKEKVRMLFTSDYNMKGYALLNSSSDITINLFGSKENYKEFLFLNLTNDKIMNESFENDFNFYNYINNMNDQEIKSQIMNTDRFKERFKKFSNSTTGSKIDLNKSFINNLKGALQAILPLSLFLILVLLFILKEKIPKYDEIILGLAFGIIGMTLFSLGIELGLSKLGNQTGQNLPSSFKAIELVDQKKIISDFNTNYLIYSINIDGNIETYFFTKDKNKLLIYPFNKDYYNENTKEYVYVPLQGPLFNGVFGIIVVILFAFFMGYGATLAEPALNALGATVEEISVGTFKKVLLMQSVAIGVGIGIAVGVCKIIWNIPLAYILVPPYLLLLFITYISEEDFVNIGWDSAGVTTGPITVPLVLAMGLGIGNQVGVIEGFGILSAASVFPILSVLLVGLYVNYKRKLVLKESEAQ